MGVELTAGGIVFERSENVERVRAEAPHYVVVERFLKLSIFQISKRSTRTPPRMTRAVMTLLNELS